MDESLRVITWLWRQENGRTQYSDLHVRIWAGMVQRNLQLPHRLAVVTDLPGDYGLDVEVIPPPRDFLDVEIPTWRYGRPQCFRRLAIFRPDAADIFQCDRVINTDLDIVITGDLGPVFDCRDDFRIARGTASTRAFNGSVFMLRLGSRPEVYTEFTPERAVVAGRKHVGSDQSWIATQLPDSPTWGPEHGVVSIQQKHLAKEPRLITYPGPLKPWMVAQAGRDPMVTKHYRGARNGRCLVLGYGETLWTDLEAALNEPFGGVIVSHETAAHWPGPVLAVADDDAHAERLAAMHGFSDVIFCGRSGGQ